MGCFSPDPTGRGDAGRSSGDDQEVGPGKIRVLASAQRGKLDRRASARTILIVVERASCSVVDQKLPVSDGVGGGGPGKEGIVADLPKTVECRENRFRQDNLVALVVREILDQVDIGLPVGHCREQEAVGTLPADQHIIALSAIKRVLAVHSGQDIALVIAGHDIGERIARAVGRIGASEREVLDPGRQFDIDGRAHFIDAAFGVVSPVVQVVENEHVVSGPAVHHVCTGTAVEHIVAGPAAQGVVAAAAHEHVIAAVTGQKVLARTTDQSVVPVAAGQMVGVRISGDDIVERIPDA